MTRPNKYGESVLFVFTQNGQILCEWREWHGRMQYSIPGGKIESIDRQSPNDQHAALVRETWEELRVIPTQFNHIGQIWHDEANWLFHIYVVSAWEGEIPANVLDHKRPLNWIDPSELEDNASMIGISTLIRKHIQIPERETCQKHQS